MSGGFVMEFRRIEVNYVVRHRELVDDDKEAYRILEAIKERGLKFRMNVGAKSLGECVVTELREDGASIFAREPQKFRTKIKFSDILTLEVESNCNFVSELDGAGRWAFVE
jgi:predicted AAA+ superfamily ATPase